MRKRERKGTFEMFMSRWYFNKKMYLIEVEIEGVEVVSHCQGRNKQRSLMDAVRGFLLHKSQ